MLRGKKELAEQIIPKLRVASPGTTAIPGKRTPLPAYAQRHCVY